MITVKFYGLLRIDSGIREMQIEAASLKSLYNEITRLCPSVEREALKRSIVLINGQRAHPASKLSEGDTVQFLSPSAGG